MGHVHSRSLEWVHGSVLLSTTVEPLCYGPHVHWAKRTVLIREGVLISEVDLYAKVYQKLSLFQRCPLKRCSTVCVCMCMCVCKRRMRKRERGRGGGGGGGKSVSHMQTDSYNYMLYNYFLFPSLPSILPSFPLISVAGQGADNHHRRGPTELHIPGVAF